MKLQRRTTRRIRHIDDHSNHQLHPLLSIYFRRSAQLRQRRRRESAIICTERHTVADTGKARGASLINASTR